MFHFNESPGYVFGVNPEGEVMRNGDLLVSCVNVCDCAREALSEDDYEAWVEHGEDRDALEDRVQDAVDHEFARQLRTELTINEFKLQDEIGKLQAVNDGRWRVYGGMKGKDEHDALKHASINLVTEVYQYTDDKNASCREEDLGVSCAEFWQRLEALAKELGAEVYPFDDGVESEHSWRTTGAPDYEKIPGSDNYGPNHGRPYKQVEIVWEIKGKSLEEVQAMIAELNPKLEEIWQTSGVNVC